MTSYRVTNPMEFEKWLDKNYHGIFFAWECELAEYMDLPEFMWRNHYRIVEEWEVYIRTRP